MSRPPLEVADVVRQHGAAFLARYGHTLSGEQHRALRAIALCRTAALGGHITQCDHCGHEELYNSCRHRSCPKCHGAAQRRGSPPANRSSLETAYCRCDLYAPARPRVAGTPEPALAHGLLFRTVAQTLQDIAGDPKHLGAEIGGFAVLHTWGQTRAPHPCPRDRHRRRPRPRRRALDCSQAPRLPLPGQRTGQGLARQVSRGPPTGLRPGSAALGRLDRLPG